VARWNSEQTWLFRTLTLQGTVYLRSLLYVYTVTVAILSTNQSSNIAASPFTIVLRRKPAYPYIFHSNLAS